MLSYAKSKSVSGKHNALLTMLCSLVSPTAELKSRLKPDHRIDAGNMTISIFYGHQTEL